MIRREIFCNKLRDLKYSFKRETDRVHLYKKPGNPTFATVPRKELLDEDNVCNTLKQCGCAQKDIDAFIKEYRVKDSPKNKK